MDGNGSFGKWITDGFGLPAYEYTCNQFLDPKAKTFTTYGKSIDHFHQIGNDRIAATVHNEGHVQVLESSRGFQWLTYRDIKKGKLGGGIALFQAVETKKIWSDLYTLESSDKLSDFKRIFGMGYFQKSFQKDELKIIHNICAPFSDDPVLISEIEVLNESNSTKSLRIIDLWDINLHHLTKSLVVTGNHRKLFGRTRILNGVGKLIGFLQRIVKMDTDGSRYKFDKKFRFKMSMEPARSTVTIKPCYKKHPPIAKDEPGKHNFYPCPMFLSMLTSGCDTFILNKSQIMDEKGFNIQWEDIKNVRLNEKKFKMKECCLGIGTEITLKPNETNRITCIFGYAEREKIDDLIKKYKDLTLNESILKFNSDKWKEALIELNHESEPWLSRETKWHSYYVRSAGFYDDYFKQHRYPQGSIYQFGHGFDGAIRDYVLYLTSIIFINPRLGKEYLTFIISLMTPDGNLPYGLHGHGKTLSIGAHSKPSDLYLFLIWGILQYVYTTRDFKFLQESIAFYPKSLGTSSTVLEKIITSLEYLFSNEVGFGEHGLIKSNDGDWSDGISLMVKSRKKFIKNGESNFNSTFALYLIPKVLPLLERFKPGLVKIYQEKLNELKVSVLKSFNGKWYYRGWDGQGTPIGNINIYLEHHTWLLISKILKKESAMDLISQIHDILDRPSPIGQYISYPPEKVLLDILPKGWDVNGGIWHAMNALLTWGYSKYDSDKAMNSLIKNSMTKRAEIYPDTWYGIWSGPDAYIADHAENRGEAFYHLATPMCDFPLMNLNLHACYLLSAIKMVGFEASHDSIEINPNLIKGNFKFTSQILSVESTENALLIEFKSLFHEQFKFKITKPSWWKNESKIVVNGNEIKENEERVSITEKLIIIKTDESQEKLSIILS